MLPPAQDITSLLHTIYEVVDSSVNHSPTSSKTLRVKLTVAPDGSQGTKGVLLGPHGEDWERVLGAAWRGAGGWSGSSKESRGGIRAGRPSLSAGGAAVGTACVGMGPGLERPAQESGREAGRTVAARPLSLVLALGSLAAEPSGGC